MFRLSLRLLRLTRRRCPYRSFGTSHIWRQEAAAAAAPAEEGKRFQDPRLRILDAALEHVTAHGWSEKSLALGAEDAGFPPTSHGLFPRGAMELLEHLMMRANEAMTRHLESLPGLESMSANERIKEGIKARLLYLAPFQSMLPQAFALSILPENAPYAAQAGAIMADELWYHAGDRSTDMTWYTRRSLLLGVYAATELYFLTDRSEGFQDTWDFLDRRLDEVSQLGRSAGDVASVAQAAGSGVLSLLGGVHSVARPFVELQAGRPGEAWSSFGSLLARAGSVAGDLLRSASSQQGSQAAAGTPEAGSGRREEVEREVSEEEFAAAAEKSSSDSWTAPPSETAENERR